MSKKHTAVPCSLQANTMHNTTQRRRLRAPAPKFTNNGIFAERRPTVAQQNPADSREGSQPCMRDGNIQQCLAACLAGNTEKMKKGKDRDEGRVVLWSSNDAEE